MDLEAIEARYNAVTEGPWSLEKVGDWHDPGWMIDGICRDRYGLNSLSIGEDKALGEFVAHAREDVPALVARVRELKEENQRMRADLESATSVQVWPLARILSEVHCGSQDWTWEEEWADLDRRHAATGYLDQLEQQIQINGITMPILRGSDGRLWDGHHRLRIAVRVGIPYVPVEIVPLKPEAALSRARQIAEEETNH
ncbi:ParB N-terminal domain-containing protein [Nocardiopsis synnemataformans]|uniref:ParB N-terminal domain-containing protein n=1 Tax=Nocardiopsis synnemataformans TaxID=61305 RepID=UPI003EBF1CFA